jgi:hypothetical protein
MMTDSTYCQHCQEQIENCLQAAESSDKDRIRAYFMMLAGKWIRLARDLESRRACGAGCPLSKACNHERAIEPAAGPKPEIFAAADRTESRGTIPALT